MDLRFVRILVLLLSITQLHAARFSQQHGSIDGGGGIAHAGPYAVDSSIVSIQGSGHIFLLNDPPAPTKDYLEIPSTGTLSIPVSLLLTNDSDFEGNTYSLSLLQTNTVHGGSVILTNGAITYIPPPVPDIRGDSFTYTITDPFGGASQGSVVLYSTNSAPHLVEIQKSSTNFTIRFKALPGALYLLQTRTSLQSGLPWLDFPDANQPLVEHADTNGLFAFVVPLATGHRFFRALDLQSLTEAMVATRTGARLTLTFRGSPGTAYKLQSLDRFGSSEAWQDYPSAAYPLILRTAGDGLHTLAIPILNSQAYFKTVPLE